MRYLLINLEVREGERVHDHHCLHGTEGKNINFAAERYVSTFWGYGEREDNQWWFHGEIIIKLESVVEISKHEHDLMSVLFRGSRPAPTDIGIGDMVRNV